MDGHFKAFYYGAELDGGYAVRWTTRSLDGAVYSDNSWPHSGVTMESSWEIDWLKIDLPPENREIVLETFRIIHVPGEVLSCCVCVYGYRTDVDYI